MKELIIGIGAGVAVAGWSIFWPTSTLWGPVISRGPNRIPPGGPARYALTFDDGPTAASTPVMLDILAELGVRATFFVIGANVRRAPHLLKRMHAEGHLIANHSFNHDHFGLFRGRRYWDRQVGDTDAVIEQAIGLRPALFRPPMGIKTGYVMGAAARRGHTVITWTRRAVDGVPTTPRRILGRLLPHTQAGDILLLHDGIEPHMRRDPTSTLLSIKPLILGLRHRGLEPAPLDELLGVTPYASATVPAPGGLSEMSAPRAALRKPAHQ